MSRTVRILGRSLLRRRAAALVTLVATASLTATGCSGSSSSHTSVPGAGPSAHTLSDAASVLDRLVTAEKPAEASRMPAGSTAAEIKKNGKLRVGGTQTAALFSLLNPGTGKVDGFDATLSRLLAKYIIGRPETQLVNVTSQTREALLRNHSVDTVFATYTITPERAKLVNFAGPYFEDGLSIQVKKGEDGIGSVKDLSGKTVVTESGSTAASAVAQQAPKARIQLFDTNTECLQALQQGRADAYVLDQGILAGNATANPDVKVLPTTFSKEPYGIGLPLDKPDFKIFVNDWLQQIEADGTWSKVWKATLGTQIPGSVPAPPKIG